MLTIIICKIAAFFGKILRRGSNLPGKIALRLNKDILSKIEMPEIVILVTGSNGKTSTSSLITAAARAAGKRVICNSEGSNQIEGVATVLLRNCKGKKVNADIAVLESDERFCQYTTKYITPTHIVVTNLFRDQITRNGDCDFVAGELGKGLPESAILILNADEPVSAALGFGRSDNIYFSVDAKKLREKKNTAHAYDDGAFCPLCHARMVYKRRLQSHLGSYSCTSCKFSRKKPAHTVSEVADGAFVIDGGVRITPQMPSMFFAYNIAAAYSVAVEAFGMAPDDAAEALTGHTLSNELVDRVLEFKLGALDGLFLLSKHENSMSYNGAIKTILDSENKDVTLVLIVDLLSRKYIANDMSWLWDIDFEQLTNKKIKKIVVGGRFANDVAARLLFAGIKNERLNVMPDLDIMMDYLYGNAVGFVYLLTCFTDIEKFRSRLKGGEAK